MNFNHTNILLQTENIHKKIIITFFLSKLKGIFITFVLIYNSYYKYKMHFILFEFNLYLK